MKNVSRDPLNPHVYHVTIPIADCCMEQLADGIVGIIRLVERNDELELQVESLDGNVIPWPEESRSWR